MNEQEQKHTDATPVFKITTPDGEVIDVEAKDIEVPKGYVLQTQEEFDKVIGKRLGAQETKLRRQYEAESKVAGPATIPSEETAPLQRFFDQNNKIIKLLEQMLKELKTINCQM